MSARLLPVIFRRIKGCIVWQVTEGKVAFIHPKAMDGVLIELVEKKKA